MKTFNPTITGNPIFVTDQIIDDGDGPVPCFVCQVDTRDITPLI